MAAEHDGYVAPHAVAEIHSHWPGSQLWHTAGGHVSGFITLNATFIKAVQESLSRLDTWQDHHPQQQQQQQQRPGAGGGCAAAEVAPLEVGSSSPTEDLHTAPTAAPNAGSPSALPQKSV